MYDNQNQAPGSAPYSDQPSQPYNPNQAHQTDNFSQHQAYYNSNRPTQGPKLRPLTPKAIPSKNREALQQAIKELEKEASQINANANKQQNKGSTGHHRKINPKIKLIAGLIVLLLVAGGITAYNLYRLPLRKLDDGKLVHEYYLDQDAPAPFYDANKKLYGYKSPDGKKVLIRPKYHYASIFRGDVAFVKKGDQGRFINRNGKTITKVGRAEDVIFDDDGKIYNANYKIYNQKGYLISEKTSASTLVSHGYYTSTDSKNNTTLYDHDANLVYDCKGKCTVSISSVHYGEDHNLYALINADDDKNYLVNLSNGETIFSNKIPLTAPADKTLPREAGKAAEPNGLYHDGESYGHHSLIIYQGEIVNDINSNYDVKPVYGQTGIFEIYPISPNAHKELYYYNAVKDKSLKQLGEAEHADYLAQNFDVRACNDKIGSFSLHEGTEIKIECGSYTSIEKLKGYAQLYFNGKSQNAAILKQGLATQIFDTYSKQKIIDLPEASNVTNYPNSPILLLENGPENEKHLYNLVSNKSIQIPSEIKITDCFSNFCIDKHKQNYYTNQ